MKRLIQQIFILLSFGATAIAQCWNPTVPNTITTDWTKPNTSNTWDWTQEQFDDIYISNPLGTPTNLPITSRNIHLEENE